MTGRPMRPSGSDRYAGMLFFLAVLLFAVGLRLAWVQGVASTAYAQRADRQRVRDMTLTPRRGSVFDREGEPLAITVDAKTVYAVPRDVADKPGTARALARILGGAEAGYLAKLQRRGAFVYLGRKVDMDRADAVARLGIKGIGFLDDSRRAYPSGELACQTLGFVGVDDRGLSGIEARYDDVLGGVPGRVLAERDPSGSYILPGGLMSYEDPVDGRSITLTIDKDIQYQAHVELVSAVKRFKARGGSVVVMDPRTGEILAMASVPNFNPNFYSSARPEAFRGKPITDTFEPGSTIKSFTAAAILEEGLYTPASKFPLPSTLKVGGRTIHEAHGRGRVTWTLSQIVTKSSNVGAVKLGLALGKKRLYRYFSAFGLAERTGVDFPGESPGAMPPPTGWSSSTIGNLPFGQGLAVTPLQVARGMSALANEGVMVTPHFLAKTAGASTEPVWPTERAVSADTALQMTGILRDVVKDGTGGEAAVAGYEVAGKTGTAQKAGRGGYTKGLYVGSFVGYLPAGDPRVLIVVTIDEPHTAIYGGAVAAPAFSRIARFCVAHLKVPPASTVRSVVPVPAAGNGKASKRPARARVATSSVLESADPER